MRNSASEKRKSGLPLIAELPWGADFCQFHRTEKDLLEILAPYFRAGLENNEFVLWIASDAFGVDKAGKALKEYLPDFEEYVSRGRMEVISRASWRVRDEKSGGALVPMLDKAILSGLDGLRLACDAFPETRGGNALTCLGAEAISRYNILALFLYPRDEFDAAGLMEAVKNHRYALVRNADGWDLIQSSEVRTVNDALSRSEEKLHSLFSNMSEGFAYHRIVLDADGKPRDYVFHEVNDAFERLTGLKGENIIGKRVTAALPGIENDPTDWIGKYGMVALTGKPMQFESHSEALGKWYAVSAFSPHKGFFAVTFSDITERKRMEQALRASEEKLRVTLTSIGDAVIATDVECRINFINPVAAHLTGWPEDEARGRLISEVFRIVNERTGEPAEDIAMRVLREGRTAALANHTALITRDGREIPIEDSAAPIRDHNGQVSGVVLVFHDVTAGRIAEEELQQAKAAAEKANQAKSIFLANMSHEIRTPMNGVLGMTDLALMKTADHQVKEYLGYVKESGLHLLNIINDILDLSRIEAGRIELARAHFSLSNLLETILEPFRSVVLRRNIKLGLNIDRAIPGQVVGDPGRLRQILVNLIGNSLKFTDEGEIALSVRKNGFDESQNRLHLLFSVRDTGVGIPPTHLEKIFDSFEQVKSAHPTEYAGTGLGLSISKNLVELMGGKIWVESREGVGSTFFFTAVLETVPIKKDEADRAPEPKPAGRSLKILVAEDNRINQVYIEALLKKEGHTVAIAKTGLQALEKLSADNYDLVLMDVRMPEMSGDEAVRLIRDNRTSCKNAKIPIIALTAYALETERERFMECGFDAYLSKPVEIAKLQEILAELS